MALWCDRCCLVKTADVFLAELKRLILLVGKALQEKWITCAFVAELPSHGCLRGWTTWLWMRKNQSQWLYNWFSPVSIKPHLARRPVAPGYKCKERLWCYRCLKDRPCHIWVFRKWKKRWDINISLSWINFREGLPTIEAWINGKEMHSTGETPDVLSLLWLDQCAVIVTSRVEHHDS